MVGKDAENFDPTEAIRRNSHSELTHEAWISIGYENGWSNIPSPTPREEVEEYLDSIGESALLMDGFDDALIGFSQRMNEPRLAVYSYDRMIDVLMKRDGMTAMEAEEYVDFNCIGAWVGEQTPVIVSRVTGY